MFLILISFFHPFNYQLNLNRKIHGLHYPQNYDNNWHIHHSTRFIMELHEQL